MNSSVIAATYVVRFLSAGQPQTTPPVSLGEATRIAEDYRRRYPGVAITRKDKS